MDEKPTEEIIETYTVKPAHLCADGKHRFQRGQGLTVLCAKCAVGFTLPTNAEVKEGHIYIDGVLAI